MNKFNKALMLLSAVALILPFCLIGIAAFAIPPQYDQSFLGALRDKYDRLSAIDGPKLVIIGGSSVAFGIDSAMLEEYTGMPTVNFGLYASLGTKAMLDLSRSSIGEGDIIIIAPETDRQTLSLYFNEESMWQAIDGSFGMLFDLDGDDLGAMLGGVWNFAARKYGFMKAGNAPKPSGVYSRSSFNEYGDISYVCEYNTMARGYDPTAVIKLEPETVDPEFIDYVNEYTAYCRNRGAEVCFSFPPMNSLALAPETTEESIFEFFSYLAGSLDCEIITDINDCIMDWEYFYDTNYHLNDAGAVIHTAELIGDIRRAQANREAFKIELPPKPKRPEMVVDSSENDTTGYFVFELIDDVMTLVGVTDSGKTQKSLTMPKAYGGIAVQTIAEEAFEGCELLEEIIIEADTHISLLENAAFSGAPRLSRIVIHSLPDAILVGEELLRGASDYAKLTVPRDHYGDFAANYFWSRYISRVETVN